MAGLNAQQRNEQRRTAEGIERLQDVEIPLPDGTHLLADVYRPAGHDRHPVIVQMGVHGRAFNCGSIVDEASKLASEEREHAWFQSGGATDSDPPSAFYETMNTANTSDWVPRGYVCLRVDSRGVGRLPGVINLLSVQESHDYYEVIEWAAKQPWSNGRVGVYGGSYNADIALTVSGLAPPSLRAMIAFAGDFDLYRDLGNPGGLSMTGFFQTWVAGNVKAIQARPEPEVVDIARRLLAHPFDEPEDYGPEGKIMCCADPSKITVPFLTSVCLGAPVHGRGGIEAFLSIKNATHKELIAVDANYWPFMYRDCLPQQFAFFDRYLKGDDTVPKYPPISVAMRTGGGKYYWQEDTQWPLSDTKFLVFYLDASTSGSGTGLLTLTRPDKQALFKYSAEAPSNATSRSSSYAVFESSPVQTDLEIAGPLSVVLWVSASAADMDVYAIFRVLDAEGQEVSYNVRPLANGCPLSHGMLKVSHRVINLNRSTPWRPYHTHRKAHYAPLTPDEVLEIHVEMLPTTARVRCGHRLQLIAEPYSNHSARAWRAHGDIAGPGSQANDEFETVGGRPYDHSYHDNVENRIHTGRMYSSRLLIPSIPMKEKD